jgi:hypothetical protein
VTNHNDLGVICTAALHSPQEIKLELSNPLPSSKISIRYTKHKLKRVLEQEIGPGIGVGIGHGDFAVAVPRGAWKNQTVYGELGGSESNRIESSGEE